MTQVIDSIFAISRYGYKAGTSPNVSIWVVTFYG
jgi:hypothetical protein